MLILVHGRGLGDGVFAHGYSLCAREVVLGDLRACHFVVTTDGGRPIHGGFDSSSIPIVDKGCRVTSIQRFLGYKKLSSTMIYARADDQTVAEDYFATMQRVEQSLEIVPESKQETQDEVVNVQELAKVFQLIEQLELSKLCDEERLDIASQLRQLLDKVNEHAPPEKTKR